MHKDLRLVILPASSISLMESHQAVLISIEVQCSYTSALNSRDNEVPKYSKLSVITYLRLSFQD